ncbi:apolipoprotein A-IV a [Corythoichthys intestinalis]|uniref:apolipoprotein A-IV a n=1 Tax=Corythoichthys intestinalis TaxID=161448 RepID=UPI0025A5333A|nr:apolipoprotein A-IV a [Corythoichthys intestinalis]XP_061808408.1 apolipoprotein A-I-like [Nerophis lumbriciformis]
MMILQHCAVCAGLADAPKTDKSDPRAAIIKLVLLAVLAFSAGCHAKVVQHSQTKAQLDMVKDAFWDYIAKASSTAEDSLALIKRSDFGKEINTLIASGGDAITRLTDVLGSHVNTSGFSERSRLLKSRLEKDLESAVTHLRPYADEFAAHFLQQLEELKKEVSSYAKSAHSGALESVLLGKSREFKSRLDDLGSQMVPYAEELARKLERGFEEFQEKAAPLARSFHNQFTEKAREIREKLGPYGEELRAKLERLAALWESFTNTTKQ